MKLEGLDKLERKLGPLRAGKHWKQLLESGGDMLRDYINVYPPLSNANTKQGPGGRWYERGYGPRWARKDGSVGGMKTSEDLRHSWAVSANSKRAIVGTNVSYAKAVQSAEHQAPFHAKRGWPTDQEAIDKMRPKILDMVRREINRILSR